MIGSIFVALRDALKADGVPFECVYGPTAVPPAIGATRIQVMRDYDAGDQVGAPRGRFQNPVVVATMAMGVLVRIHAQATVANAQRYEHEEIADRIADQVLAKLHKIIRAAKTTHVITRAGYVVDLKLPDSWQGVTYEIRLQIARSVPNVTWAGAGAGEMTMTADTAVTALDAVTGSPAPAAELPNAMTRIES